MELPLRLPLRESSFSSKVAILFGILLYSWIAGRLLGWSAFAGFIILLIGWPLNNFVARRSVRIQKGVLAARDKRMGVLNELIGAVGLFSSFE